MSGLPLVRKTENIVDDLKSQILGIPVTMQSISSIKAPLLSSQENASRSTQSNGEGLNVRNQPTERIREKFENPGSEFRGKPFWSWNGDLNRDELLRQIQIFKDMGMGGVFMHSRTGLKTEYLGKEWFELINACADECERLGLEAWLYDEDRWPSGTAGGMATENPEYRMKALHLHVYEPSQVQWPAREAFIAAFVADLEDLKLGAYEAVDYGDASVKLSDGKRRVLIFEVVSMVEHSFYNGQTYLNTLDRKATEHFLNVTHEKYRKNCGTRLGRSIKGIFTDEPHHGLVMCHNSEQRTATEAPDWSVPYTDGLFEKFSEKWSYDLRSRLPELFLLANGSRVSQVKWHYMELLQQLFLENWAIPCLEWCKKNDLLLTGHVLHEDSLVAQAVPCGSVMRYYELMDYPGVDLLCNNNRSYWVAKQLQSSGRQLGKKWLLSELYGCTGWQFDFASHKETGLWQALFGINLRCHHLSWVTMAGEAKRDYPASISFQSGWSQEYGYVEDFFSRLHVILQNGEPMCDVLVVNPVESVWSQIHPGWAQWLGAKDSELRKLEEQYEELFHWLAGSQIDFDYGDEEQLARLGSWNNTSEGPVLRIGEAAYRVVVVAGMATIRSSTLAILEAFHAAGGRVIFLGEPPAHVDALPSPRASNLAAHVGQIGWNRDEAVSAIRNASEIPLSVECDSSSVFVQARQAGEDFFFVAINTSRLESDVEIRFSLPFVAHVEEWVCENGLRHKQPTVHEDGKTLWKAKIPPLGCIVFSASPDPADNLAAKPAMGELASHSCTGPFEFTLNEPNLCVLDYASARIGDGPWSQSEEILNLDIQIREKLGFPPRSGFMLQPWAVAKHGLHATKQSSPLALRFDFEVEALPGDQVDLVMEMPEKFSVLLNGKSVELPSQSEWLIDPCLKRIPLPNAGFQLGVNTLELRVDFLPEVDLEAIYLAGNFGVRLKDATPVLTQLPSHLNPGDVSAQGLPFYSGSISYRIPFPEELKKVASSPDKHIWRLQVPEFGGAMVKVGLENSPESRVIAWPPYHAEAPCQNEATAMICEVYLTRINTFGPLHIHPKEQNGIAPDSFRTKGIHFVKKPQLWASGLLSNPVISVVSV